jgi:hypothetical protein
LGCWLVEGGNRTVEPGKILFPLQVVRETFEQMGDDLPPGQQRIAGLGRTVLLAENPASLA